MRGDIFPLNIQHLKIISIVTTFSLLVCLCGFQDASAGGIHPGIFYDSVIEKKVDYLERIYFSGENKNGLNLKILIALQELQEKSPTPSLAKQVTFLLEIQDKANEAANACDLLELIAVGIFSIDAAEGERQGIKMPSKEAKAAAVDAVASLNKLNTTSAGLGTSASSLAWSNYLLNGGKSTGFISGANKVAGAASTVGTVASAAGAAAQTVNDAKDLARGLGIGFKKQDKKCNDVVAKNIEIGEHLAKTVNPAPANSMVAIQTSNSVPAKPTGIGGILTTVIDIGAVTTAYLRAITDTLRNNPVIQSAEKAYNEKMSTITVTHSGTLDALADWIEDKFVNKVKLITYGNGKISLAVKTK